MGLSWLPPSQNRRATESAESSISKFLETAWFSKAQGQGGEGRQPPVIRSKPHAQARATARPFPFLAKRGQERLLKSGRTASGDFPPAMDGAPSFRPVQTNPHPTITNVFVGSVSCIQNGRSDPVRLDRAAVNAVDRCGQGSDTDMPQNPSTPGPSIQAY